MDSSRNPVTATEDKEKANVLGQFFSTVFTDEKTETEEIPKRNINIPVNSISFDEKVILAKISNINISKSSGPDNLHLIYYMKPETNWHTHSKYYTRPRITQAPYPQIGEQVV